MSCPTPQCGVHRDSTHDVPGLRYVLAEILDGLCRPNHAGAATLRWAEDRELGLDSEAVPVVGKLHSQLTTRRRVQWMEARLSDAVRVIEAYERTTDANAEGVLRLLELVQGARTLKALRTAVAGEFVEYAQVEATGYAGTGKAV